MLERINLSSICAIEKFAFRACNKGCIGVKIGKDIFLIDKCAFSHCKEIRAFEIGGKPTYIKFMKFIIKRNVFLETSIKSLKLPQSVDEQEFRDYYDV